MTRSHTRAAALACAALGCATVAGTSQAALFKLVTAETGGSTNASIAADGTLTESGNTYACIYKPDPQASWVRTPWLSPSQFYAGTKSIGYEIGAVASPTPGAVDKVNTRVSHVGESSSQKLNTKRYLGFALKLATGFAAPAAGGHIILAQYWQGSPYGPPVSLTITGGNSTTMNYELQVRNNSTKGNPSSVPVTVGSGTIPVGSWQTFNIMTIMDYNGAGQLKLWQNGTQLMSWTGNTCYDPNTIPYNNPPAGTANPLSDFDVFIGMYRTQQNAKQQLFYDSIKWGDTFADTAALTATLPEPMSLATIASALSLVLARRR
jgi:hypothetical protein